MHAAALTQTTNSSQAPARPARLLRLPDVEARVGFKKSSIYAALAKNAFPKPVRLGARCVAWHEHEIDSWIAARTRVEGLQ